MKLGPDVHDALRIGLRHRKDQEELHVVSHVCLVTSASAKVTGFSGSSPFLEPARDPTHLPSVLRSISSRSLAA